MEALAFTLAKEERPNGIHVNVVAPGIVETDMGMRLAGPASATATCRTCARSMPCRRSGGCASRSTWPTSCCGCAATGPATSPASASNATAGVSVFGMTTSPLAVSPLATPPPPTSLGQIVDITPAALTELSRCAPREPDAERLGLRLEIVSGPGEDFRYDLSLDVVTKAAFTDEVRTVRHDDQTIKVIIPAGDVDLLQDAVLDHTESQGLVIRNPNRPKAPSVEGLTSDDALSAEIEALVAGEVNPALAAHGGFVTYVGHDGEGTVYMTMGGGCHGCSMSKMTMLDGVQTMLSEQIPAVERVRDLTDHATGENPYYS